MKNLILISSILLTACTPVPVVSKAEMDFPKHLQTSYTCNDSQWINVERRLKICEAQGWGSKPFSGCPTQAIISECIWKGNLSDNSYNSQTQSTTQSD